MASWDKSFQRHVLEGLILSFVAIGIWHGLMPKLERNVRIFFSVTAAPLNAWCGKRGPPTNNMILRSFKEHNQTDILLVTAG